MAVPQQHALTARVPATLRELPYNVAAWSMWAAAWTLEQEAAVHRAMRYAWCAELRGEPECSLPSDRTALRQILGTRRVCVQQFIQKLFRPVAGDPSRLRWSWLMEQYVAAAVRREKARRGGRAGGRGRRGFPHSSNRFELPYSSPDGEERGAAATQAAPPLVERPPIAMPPPTPAARSSPLVDAEDDKRAARAWLDARPDARAALATEADARVLALAPCTSEAARRDIRQRPSYAGWYARLFEELALEAYHADCPPLQPGGSGARPMLTLVGAGP